MESRDAETWKKPYSTLALQQRIQTVAVLDISICWLL